jgi:hypothetical protein
LHGPDFRYPANANFERCRPVQFGAHLCLHLRLADPRAVQPKVEQIDGSRVLASAPRPGTCAVLTPAMPGVFVIDSLSGTMEGHESLWHSLWGSITSAPAYLLG